MTFFPKPHQRQAESPVSNARLIAELQAVAIAIHIVGLDRLPEVMKHTPTQEDQPHAR